MDTQHTTSHRHDGKQAFWKIASVACTLALALALLTGALFALSLSAQSLLDSNVGTKNYLSKYMNGNNDDTATQETVTAPPAPKDTVTEDSSDPMINISGNEYMIASSVNGVTQPESDVTFAAHNIYPRNSGKTDKVCADIALINSTKKSETVGRQDIGIKTPLGNYIESSDSGPFTSTSVKPGKTYAGTVCFDLKESFQKPGQDYTLEYSSLDRGDDTYSNDASVSLPLENK